MPSSRAGISMPAAAVVVTLMCTLALGAVIWIPPNPPGTSSSTSSISSSSSTSSPSTTTTTSTVPPFNGDWYNLRGPYYPWQWTEWHPDQSGSTSPEWTFSQFRQLGWNLVRMDMGSWYLYSNSTTHASFMANMTRVFDAADANGVYVVFQPIPAYGELPSDVRAAWLLSTWWGHWWANDTYPGTDPALRGLGIWQAFFKGYTLPMLQAFGNRPSMLMLKFINEPNSPSNGVLATFYATMGRLARTQAGWTGYISYESSGGRRGEAGLIIDILSRYPNFGPAVYDIHYPTADQVVSDAQAAAALGVRLWVGEMYASWLTSTYVGDFRQYNVASCINRWDEDGTYLVKWSGGWRTAPTPGTPTVEATTVSNLDTQYLGTAVFFR